VSIFWLISTIAVAIVFLIPCLLLLIDNESAGFVVFALLYVAFLQYWYVGISFLIFTGVILSHWLNYFGII
jgi:hypothetical protein